MWFIYILKRFVYTVSMKEKPIKNSALSDRLTKVLKAKKLKKTRLAEMVGVTPQAINNWFNRGELGRESAQKVADALNVSIDWLLNGDPEDILTIEQIRHNRFCDFFKDGFPEGIEDSERELLEEIYQGKVLINDRIARRIELDYKLPYAALDYDPNHTPINPLQKLADEEIELLHLFRQMPKSARAEMLAMFNSRVNQYAAIFQEMLERTQKNQN